MRAVASSVAIFLCLLTCACGTAPKLSEGGRQIAYSAGLGVDIRRTARPAVVTVAARRCTPRSASVGSEAIAHVALLHRAIIARAAPRSSAAAVADLQALTPNGFPQALAVIDVHRGTACSTDWYRVGLPVLPNGTTGWVRAWAVRTYTVRSRIVVDLTRRRLQLFRSGRLRLTTIVGIGAPSTPTPTGRYVVNERYVLPDATGPFGPAALGISAHSNVLARVWVQDGPIGIHGTNEPSSIGRAASHGCVRVANDVMRRLFRLAPAGTPVVIRP